MSGWSAYGTAAGLARGRAPPGVRVTDPRGCSGSSTTRIQAVVLCGGAGTRLWPLSRPAFPKPLLALDGGATLLQRTLARLDHFAGPYPLAPGPIVVASEDHRFVAAEQLRVVGATPSTFIVEPGARNTAPALTLAAHAAARDGGDPILLAMPADHAIADPAAFQDAVAGAARLAAAGALVTLGVRPTRPETAYGYIEVGELVDGGPAHRVAAFVEKPDATTARGYVEGGQHLWNSGIFVMRASRWLAAVARFRPDIADAAARAYTAGSGDGDFYRVDATVFRACPAESIDYAVMEKAPGAGDAFSCVVVPLAAGWSDIGAFDALAALLPGDDAGNTRRGDVVLHDARNTLAYADSRLVACLGVRDLVVVDTPDVVLVADKARSQDVKRLVARLEAEGRSEVAAHRRGHRPWGFYDRLDAGEGFQVKRLVVQPGASLSLQLHRHRAEHWVVVRGEARVTRGDERFVLGPDQSTYIPRTAPHRLENAGPALLEVIEVQSGEYLGEDDIVRLDDRYGRT